MSSTIISANLSHAALALMVFNCSILTHCQGRASSGCTPQPQQTNQRICVAFSTAGKSPSHYCICRSRTININGNTCGTNKNVQALISISREEALQTQLVSAVKKNQKVDQNRFLRMSQPNIVKTQPLTCSLVAYRPSLSL